LLVPSRTKKQCWHKWHDTLDPSVGRASGRIGKWTAVEDSKLKDAVQLHGGKGWAAISALVPGRTGNQCRQRWRHTLDPNIALTAGGTGKWEEDEDIKLKDKVQLHDDKDWAEISALVPGRTGKQCRQRWRHALDANTGRASTHKCKWTAIEDNKLKYAVQTHGDKGWNAISLLVPGRTGKQCNIRWRLKKHKRMDRNRTTVRKKNHVILKTAPAVVQDSRSP
jgi:myb proto-oncogene protein